MGELLMSFRVESADTHCRKFARSFDGGLTFEPYFEPKVKESKDSRIPDPNFSCIPDPTCQASLLSLFGGRLLLTSNPGSQQDRKNLQIYFSLDGGKSFQLLGQLIEGA